MALNDTAVLTAAVGWVFTAPVGTAAPTPAQVAALDPATYGDDSATVNVTATGGTFTLSVGGQTTAAIAYNATAAAVKTAVELLTTVGSGYATVTGTNATSGLTLTITKEFTGSISGSGSSLTGGTLAVVTSSWKNIGHTSRDDLPEFGFDGGDTEVKGTWQNESLREVVTDPVADYLTLMLHQFDTESFELYYGANASTTPGVFGVANGSPAPIEKALLIIIVDGDSKIGFYSPKASLRRDDSISLSADEFASLPVRATFLKHLSTSKFDWIAQDLFT